MFWKFVLINHPVSYMKFMGYLLNRVLAIVITFIFASTYTNAQIPYGYAPSEASAEELSALGGGKNQFVQGAVLFDPSEDPALQRLQGHTIRGIRCYLSANYKQARQKRSAVFAALETPSNTVRTTYADFSTGWNDILFEEPLIIGESKIYLGVQAYETIGTPYPLVAYAAATVPHSCLVNQGKKTWEEYTDRGTLLILALLDDDSLPMLRRTAYAQNTTHPQTVAPATDFEGTLYVHNFSDQPLSSLEVAMQGEGDEQPTVRELALPAPLSAYASTCLTTLLHAGTAEGTQVSWTATVVRTNGEEAQPGRPGTTTLYVTRDKVWTTTMHLPTYTRSSATMVLCSITSPSKLSATYCRLLRMALSRPPSRRSAS